MAGIRRALICLFLTLTLSASADPTPNPRAANEALIIAGKDTLAKRALLTGPAFTGDITKRSPARGSGGSGGRHRSSGSSSSSGGDASWIKSERDKAKRERDFWDEEYQKYNGRVNRALRNGVKHDNPDLVRDKRKRTEADEKYRLWAQQYSSYKRQYEEAKRARERSGRR